MQFVLDVFQVSEHFTEAGSSGASAPGAASRSHTERRHGDITWDLSHRCLSGREPFQVNKARLNHSVSDVSTLSVLLFAKQTRQQNNVVHAQSRASHFAIMERKSRK